MRVSATRTYLEMTDRADAETPAESDSLRFERLRASDAAFYRRLYCEVGRDHQWIDRLAWTDGEIASHLRRSGLSVWVMFEADQAAGYVELVAAGGSTEIAYFGLRPGFIGRGLGRLLLNLAMDRAWKTGANRIWLHTSSLDHPSALPNYLKRGFTPFRTEEYELEI